MQGTSTRFLFKGPQQRHTLILICLLRDAITKAADAVVAEFPADTAAIDTNAADPTAAARAKAVSFVCVADIIPWIACGECCCYVWTLVFLVIFALVQKPTLLPMLPLLLRPRATKVGCCQKAN